MDPETKYRMLGRLIEEMPVIPAMGELPQGVHKWIGRVDALIADTRDDQFEFRLAVTKLGMSITREMGVAELRSVIFRALAASELAAPPAVRGSFIPVGSTFDAFAALAKLLSAATSQVLIVDPYMDETVLTEFGSVVSPGVTIRLLADGQNHSAALVAACQKWVKQHDSRRPLLARESPKRALHDRALIVDGKDAWTLTQSLKDFAKRSSAEIVNAGDIANLKIPAYETIWSQSAVIV